MRQVVIAITMCLALLACKTTEQALTESGKKPMTAANIKQLLGGKTVEGTSSRGFPFQVTTLPTARPS